MIDNDLPPATLNGKLRLNASDTFASLRHPNYRLWFIGQLISLVGTWMQSTAQGFLIYELTHSATYLGYVGFAAGLPTWIFMLYGGLVADRMHRRNLLVITQAAMMILAALLAWLTFAGRIQPWQILIFAFCLGIANAFDAPARHAFVFELVPREDLTNAIALNSAMFTSATAIGPAVGGVIYALIGPAWCFSVNAISFVAVIAALLHMKFINVDMPSPRQRSALKDIKTGISYVAHQKLVRTLIFNVSLVSLFGFSFVTLMPAWAVEVLGGNATTNGLLQSARGVGSLIAALMTAALSRRLFRGKLITIGSIALPFTLLILAPIHWMPIALLIIVLIGWASMTLLNNSMALVQTTVPDDLRGRVMSIYILFFFGFMPIGSLIAGSLASRYSEQITVVLSALVLLAMALIVIWRVPELRRTD